MEHTQSDAAEPLGSSSRGRPVVRRSTLMIGAGLIATFALVNLALNRAESASGQSEVKIGLKISPVPLNLRGKNRALVGLGSYIVNAQGACVGCHTSPQFQPGGNPHLGEPEQINTENFLAGGNRFGPFTSPNITPDATGKPGGLSFEDFDSLMRSGRHSDGHHHEHFTASGEEPLLQVMPWPTYAKMTKRDMRAIYEYLRAIPHAEPAVD